MDADSASLQLILSRIENASSSMRDAERVLDVVSPITPEGMAALHHYLANGDTDPTPFQHKDVLPEGDAALDLNTTKRPAAYAGPDPVIVALAAYRNVTREIRQPAMPWRRWRQPNQRLTQTAHP